MFNKKIIIIYFVFMLSAIVVFGQSGNSTFVINNTVSASTTKIINQYPNYPATPGDVYEISFLTAGNVSNSILKGFVDNNYNIDLSFLGIINVKGLTFSEVQNLLKKTITQSYPGSIVNVMITSPGQFKVSLLGEVNEAMQVDALSITTLAELIKDKTTEFASFRDIEIKSENGDINVYDLFKFKRFADLKNNPYLRPNDTVTIKTNKRAVILKGQVKRPGTYQLISGDTLEDLINLYGGGFTKISEKSQIVITRSLGSTGGFADKTLYINAETLDISEIDLNDYDIVTIGSRLTYNPRITVQGAVSTPDSGEIGTSVSNKVRVSVPQNSRVSKVIAAMKGTFNLTSDLQNAFILRHGEKLNVDIESVLHKIDSDQDIVVEDEDMLIIPFRQLRVYVAGAVNSGGPKPFIENRTAMYYIGLAGGFDNNENMFRSYSIKDVYGNTVDGNAIISPEDLIWVNRDNPFSYISQYGGWITTITAAIVGVSKIDELIKALAK